MTQSTTVSLLLCGNSNDEIELYFDESMREVIFHFIRDMREANPPVAAADFDAAEWICWRDDDDWGDPFAPLTDMIEEELETERFLDAETLEETVLPNSYT